MQLDSLTRPDLIFPDLPGTNVHSVLQALSRLMQEQGSVEDADELYRRLLEREELGSTGIGSGVAIPHCKVDGLDKVILAIGLSSKGVDFDAADRAQVRLFFLIMSPTKQPTAHLHALSAVSKWVKADQHVERILELGDRDAIYDLIRMESTL